MNNILRFIYINTKKNSTQKLYNCSRELIIFLKSPIKTKVGRDSERIK